MNSLAEIEIERLETLPAATLLRLVEKSKRVKKNLAAFQETLRLRPEMFTRLEALDVEPGFDMEDGGVRVAFSGSGEKLGAVWGVLRRAGYTTYCRPEKGKSEFYTWWDCEGLARVWMHFTSSVCQRVKVGEKTVTVDVYETRCGADIPELEDKPAVPALTVIEGGVDELPF